MRGVPTHKPASTQAKTKAVHCDAALHLPCGRSALFPSFAAAAREARRCRVQRCLVCGRKSVACASLTLPPSANSAASPPEPLQRRCVASRVAAGAPTPCHRRAARAAAHPRSDAARTRRVVFGIAAARVARALALRWLAQGLRLQAAAELARWRQPQDAAAPCASATRGAIRAVCNAGSAGCRAAASALRCFAPRAVLAVRLRRTPPAPRSAPRLRCLC